MNWRMTRFSNLFLICGLLIGGTEAQAQVTLRLIDVKNRILQAEYQIEISVSKFESKKYFTFPDDGFTFAADSVKVIRVKNLETGQDMRWSLVPAKNDPNSQMLQVSFQIEVPEGQLSAKFIADIVVEGRTNDISVSQDGTVWIRYATSRDMIFVVPSTNCLVETSEPAKLSSSKEGFIAFCKGGHLRTVEFAIK